MSELYQSIVFELSDGRLITATVPAFCHVGDPVSVKEIRVTNPSELPEGFSFDELVKDEPRVIQKDAK